MIRGAGREELDAGFDEIAAGFDEIEIAEAAFRIAILHSVEGLLRAGQQLDLDRVHFAPGVS